MEQKKSKFTILAGIIIAIVLITGIIATVYLQTAGKESKITKDIELADQYLEDLKYEQAIALYEEVLSIDPVNKEALTGGSKAYAGLAGSQDSFDTALENLEQAIALAQKAYETYAEETEVQSVLLDAYTQAGDICSDAERYEDAIGYYEMASELAVDDSLKGKQEEIQNKIEELQKLLEEQKQKEEEEARNKAYEELLKPVLEAWQSGDIETAKSLFISIKANVSHGLYNTMTRFCLESDEATAVWDSTYNNGYINILTWAVDYTRQEYIYVVGDIKNSIHENTAWGMNEEQTNLQYGLPGFAESWSVIYME